MFNILNIRKKKTMTSVRKRSPNFIVRESKSGIVISDKKFSCTSFQVLHQFQQEDTLCDVLLKAEEQTLCAHKVVLAAGSDYFKAMFTLAMEESKQKEVAIDGISFSVLQKIVSFLYSGVLQVQPETVQEMLMAADMIQLEELKESLAEYMTRQITVANCIGIHHFANSLFCPKLGEKALEVIKQRFTVVIQMEEFLSLDSDHVLKFIDLPDLHLGLAGEDAVVDCIIRWLQRDTLNRMAEAEKMLSCVRWSGVTWEYLKTLEDHPLLLDHPNLFESISNYKQGITKAERAERQPFHQIVAVGGYLQSRTGPKCPRLKTVEKLNIHDSEEECRWHSMSAIPIIASGFCSFVMYGQLITTAFQMDETGQSPDTMRCMFEYNPVLEEWEPFTGATSEVLEIMHSCLSLGGAITYCDKTKRLFTVSHEKVYHISVQLINGEVVMQEYQQLPQLPEYADNEHRDHALAILNGKLYSMGGSDVMSVTEYFPTQTVYMYDENLNEWKKKHSMTSPRSKLCAVSLDGNIYAIGGFSQRRLRTVECYNPIMDIWLPVACMDKERSHLAGLAAGGYIYVMGGKSYAFGCGGARKVLSTCERYDSKKNIWTSVAPMAQARCLLGAAVLY